jgi:protein TonB
MRKTIYLLTFLTCIVISACGQKENEKSDHDVITDPIEYSARFPGGIDSLKLFIKTNLIQPTEKKTGTVFVAFIVNKDGTTSDFEVVRGLTIEHDAHALEVLKKMPRWIPGTQHGVVIRQRFVMPVKFE